MSIETSTKVCSIALHRDKSLIGVIEYFEDQSHSKVLVDQINFLIRTTGNSLGNIDAIAVSKGPGSYTGLRIGVATAKGLCFALEKPLIGINTLEAMAFGVNKLNPLKYNLCPMIDARRMEVYCCVIAADGSTSMATTALVIEKDSFQSYLKDKPILFFGNGSEKCKELFSINQSALFLTDIYPSAINIGYLADTKFEAADFEDTAYFEPFYLKEFISTNKNIHGN